MHISFVSADSPKVSVLAELFTKVHSKWSGELPVSGFGGAKNAGFGSSQVSVWNTVSAPIVAVNCVPCLCMWLAALSRFMSKGSRQSCCTVFVEFGLIAKFGS